MHVRHQLLLSVDIRNFVILGVGHNIYLVATAADAYIVVGISFLCCLLQDACFLSRIVESQGSPWVAGVL
jgi:hypothetical protein